MKIAASYVRRFSVALMALTLLGLSACANDDGGNGGGIGAAPTNTSTNTPAHTATPTAPPTDTPEPTATATHTLVNTATPSRTQTSTATPVPTNSGTPTATNTSTITSTPTPSSTPTATDSPTPFPTGLRARGSVEQVYVLDAQPGELLTLMDGDGTAVMSGSADDQGSLIFRLVPAGEGYEVMAESGAVAAVGTVLRPDQHPDQSFYDNQQINQGYGYLETRDGTLLAVNVLLPGPVDRGPYPTVVEYSGYDPANPRFPQPSSLTASTLGYAVAGVNMRGMGCSGGAFDFFETLQSTDGYDVIEAIAAQPWVKNNRVGMVGLSYPGITQLFVAATQPPHLASIAPLSVISNIGAGILYPGGMLNNGFAVEWGLGRQADAMVGGQPWSRERMEQGDQVCIYNQKVRGQTPDVLEKIRANPFYYPEVADPLSPETFVDKIKVPVFLSGAWQDEQTGGYFATMIDRFTGTDNLFVTLVNGGHTEPFSPAIFSRWMEFLAIYVRQEIPRYPSTAGFILNVLSSAIFDAPGLRLAPERFRNVATYDEAKALFESDPRIRVLFENGAGGVVPGSPVHSFEQSFDSWPIPSLQPTAWYFNADGQLTPAAPEGDGADSYLYDTSRSQLRTFNGSDDGIWKALPDWNWRQLREGRDLAYATDPLEDDVVIVGSSSADLWLQSTGADVDVQVVLSEIRPDGQEVYVTAGWLRASHRKVDELRSTENRPIQTHREEDAEDLPAGEFVLARVEIYPVAHVFRQGSRIRVSIGNPGAIRPRWKFEALEAGEDVINRISRSAAMPSRIVLPVVPGIEAPAQLPPCPGLRGQPCRTYEDLSNTSAEG
jgi:predicted acyl esterase